MLKIIANILRDKADLLEKGNSNIDADGCRKVLLMLDLLENGDLEMTKLEACDYIGVCRATFHNYVRDGFLPKGNKHEGTKALFWNKSDLDKCYELINK